ncbi:MAG TPA: hypothetical protein VLB01_02870 [Thermodesulfobacteriota bacterium]|nr:hypothetical protein [Thermodesulfobacteriota bacterium]
MAENLEEKLRILQEQSQKYDRDISELTKKRDTLKGDITALEKTVNETTQVVGVYGKVYENIQKEKKEIENYSQKTTPIIENAIGDKKKVVDEKVREFDDWIKKQGEEIDRQKKELGEAHEKAKKGLESKQREYDSLKTLQTDF